MRWYLPLACGVRRWAGTITLDELDPKAALTLARGDHELGLPEELSDDEKERGVTPGSAELAPRSHSSSSQVHERATISLLWLCKLGSTIQPTPPAPL